MSNKSAAQDTIAELDSMESNLRRLGLGSDTAVDPVSSNSREATEAYMTRIRTTKDERRKLKHEKELRQFMISAKESDNERYLSRVAETKRVQTIVDGAPDMLKAENMRAAAVVKGRTAQGAENTQRAEQLRKGQQLQRDLLAERSEAESLRHPLPSAADCQPEDLVTLSAGSVKSGLVATLHHDDAISFCEGLVQGVVDLSVLVSDNRHLPEPDVSGEPVQRLIQDLGVTQWSAWVQQCLHPREPSSVGEEGADMSNPSMTRTAGSPSSPQRAAADADALLQERMVTELRDLAKDHIATVAQQDAARNEEVGQAAVLDALAAFLQENERAHKVACEAIRRECSEESDEAAPPDVAAVGGAMEEVVPRWAQKMPPAATFLNGDDLSGARLLAEKIEQAARLQASTAAGTAGTGAAEDGSPVTGKSGKKTSAPHAPVGVAVRDGGVRNIFVTPRTLTGQLALSASGAPGTRSQLGSAGRGRTAAGKSSGGAGGGAGGGRRVSNLNGDDEERREMELLSEMLSRELLSLHVHNIHALTRGSMPLPPSMASQDTLAGGSSSSTASPTATPTGVASPVKSCAAAAGGHSNSSNAPPSGHSVTTPPPQRSTGEPTAASPGATSISEPPYPLQTLFLVGFPDSDVFYRLLCDKLRSQMDAVELEMLTEGRRLADAAADGAVAAANSNSPAGKGKAPRPPSRIKATKGLNSKGSASNLAAQRQLSAASDTLLRSKVFPPLCILGFFLEYSVPTRHMRLRDATVRAVSGAGGPETNASAAAAAAASAAATPAPPLDMYAVSPGGEPLMGLTAAAGGIHGFPRALSHPIFAPPSPTAPLSASRDAAGGHGGLTSGSNNNNNNRDRPSTTQSSFSVSVPPSGRALEGSKRGWGSFVGAGVPQPGATPVGELWSTELMQRELVEQDQRMRAWQETWCGCFRRVSAASLRKVAQAATTMKQLRRRSADKNGGGAAGATGTTAASQRKASHLAGGGAANAHDNNNNNNNSNSGTVGGEAGASKAATVTLPKVLFFFRKEDVGDMDPRAEDIANDLIGKTEWQWLSCGLASGCGGGLRQSASLRAQESDDMDAAAAGGVDVDSLQTRWAALLVGRLLDITVHSSARVFTNEALAPHQLPTPLRLSDYRLPREALARLVTTYETFTRHPLVVSRGKRARAPVLASNTAALAPLALSSSAIAAAEVPSALAAELDLQRVFSLYLAETLDLLRTRVFRGELWRQSAAQQLTTVAHYATVDDDYEDAKTALLGQADESRQRLYARAAVLLRLVVDDALASTADALARLTSTLLTTCFIRPNAQLDASMSLGSCPSLGSGDGQSSGPSLSPEMRAIEEAARTRFLARWRRLTEGEVQALVSPFFVQESIAEAKAAMWAALEPYAQEVHSSATTCLAEALEQAEHDFTKSTSHDASVEAAGPNSGATPCPRADWSAIAPSMVARVVARTFLLPAGEAGISGGSTPVVTGVSAALVRTVVAVQELAACFDAASQGSGEWLETMYRIALHVPADASYPDACRPPSMAALLCPPSLEAATDGDADMREWGRAVQSFVRAVGEAEEESVLWQQCRLELLLADVSLYNTPLLTENAFVHCAALHQLRDLSWYADCDSNALAKAVDFSVNGTDDIFNESEEARWTALLARHPDLFMGFTLAGDLGPLAPDGPATIAQLRVVFSQHAEPATITTTTTTVATAEDDGARVAVIDVRQWCCDVVRCSASLETLAPLCGVATSATPLARPSSRELRAVVLTLPYGVVVQAMLASAATDRGEDYMTSAAPSSLVTAESLDPTAWLQTCWWRDLALMHRPAVSWSLLRALTARYVLTTTGVLSTPAPRLPTVLRWLARAACGVHPHLSPATYLEAIYHCLAALQYRLQIEERAATVAGNGGAESTVATCIDPHAVPPLAADDVVVRAADFAYYLGETGPALVSATTAARLPLATDALLLVQAAGDGVTGVTLPLLLSSQWGRSLVQRHNPKSAMFSNPIAQQTE